MVLGLVNRHEKRFRLFELVLYGELVSRVLDKAERVDGFVLQREFTRKRVLGKSCCKMFVREFLTRLVEDDILVCEKFGARNGFCEGSKFGEFLIVLALFERDFVNLRGSRYVGA